MKKIWTLWIESIRFALGALRANLLRTLLSLLGVTVGIFAIIAVFTLVDSLEINIRQSMSFFGDRVIYVQKWPWIFEKNYPWYRFVNRPVASMTDYRFLEKNVTLAEAMTLYVSKGDRTVRFENNSMEGINVIGMTYPYNQVNDVRLQMGRYFSPAEMDRNMPLAIIGDDMATTLYGTAYPIGKTFQIKGKKFTVIGVMQHQGTNLIGLPSNDVTCMIPYSNFSELYRIKNGWLEPVIAIKGRKDDKKLQNLEGEIRGLLRNRRGLKSFEDDNFALNRPELIASTITQIFDSISIAGAIIGSFSILVGGFGIANIMFVSVKERTNQIGIQKSLGARNSFILNQFLFEAVFLSLIGGVAGLLLVSLLTFIPSSIFEIIITTKNVLTGLGLSVSIGLIAGIAPAISAANLNPVEAIRSK
ncbi:MAG TPA: ABC transporter permease [Catalimonadaceae bacterium]|nr:ABC transporter permease [Catalimonadaceae bacterium]